MQTCYGTNLAGLHLDLARAVFSFFLLARLCAESNTYTHHKLFIPLSIWVSSTSSKRTCTKTQVDGTPHDRKPSHHDLPRIHRLERLRVWKHVSSRLR